MVTGSFFSMGQNPPESVGKMVASSYNKCGKKESVFSRLFAGMIPPFTDRVHE
jgi:hypothetical protein